VGSGFYAQLRDILRAHGCSVVRQGKGSHEVWRSPITKRTFPVAVTVNNRHTANEILKQAGIGKRF
jgi:predicted RNA binding protein YcfA (HicA-like mRNA interferase family)